VDGGQRVIVGVTGSVGNLQALRCAADEARRRERIGKLKSLLEERIVLLDGAMGTMVQHQRLSDAAFRGERFRAHGRDLKGNTDILALTQPAVIAGIHRAYLQAGADIIETNTFTSNAPSQADYGTEALVPELNYRAARIAREVADEHARATSRAAFVAGTIGPTNRMASLSPDVNDPGARNITFDELADTYRHCVRSLVLAEVDLLLIETVFDTLNAKAAIYAAHEVFEELGVVHDALSLGGATVPPTKGKWPSCPSIRMSSRPIQSSTTLSFAIR